MSWRDTLGPATFRGVPFVVPTVDRTTGRRLVIHEYPFRDDPFAEDMGRKTRGFSVEGFIIGPDYTTDLQALIEALEAPGSGQLVLPYAGSRNVAVGTVRVRESDDEGGMARLQIEFVETPLNPIQPSSVTDGVGAVVDGASGARDSISTEFLGSFNPGLFVESAYRAIDGFVETIDSVVATVQMGAQELASLKYTAAQLQAKVVTLVGAPEEMFDALNSTFDLFTTRSLCLGVYNFNPGPSPVGTTPARVQETQNFDALQHVIQRLAVIRGSELILQETFVSFEEAVTARESLTDLIDEQAEVVADDTFPAMVQLRASIVAAVPGATSDLPNLVVHTPLVTVPSLLLAFRLYNSVDQELDLVARNNLANPAFVKGGAALEILSNG